MRELKEMLKTPFIVDGAHIYDSKGLYVTSADDVFIHFINDAMNEKAERDFAEPLRWQTDEEKFVGNSQWYFCPKCRSGSYTYISRLSNYCPHCGRKLGKPA